MIYLSYPIISTKRVNRRCVLDCLVDYNLRNFAKICSYHLQGEGIVESFSNPFSGIGSGSNVKLCSVLRIRKLVQRARHHAVYAALPPL